MLSACLIALQPLHSIVSLMTLLMCHMHMHMHLHGVPATIFWAVEMPAKNGMFL
jgi:hypothetical protein